MGKDYNLILRYIEIAETMQKEGIDLNKIRSKDMMNQTLADIDNKEVQELVKKYKLKPSLKIETISRKLNKDYRLNRDLSSELKRRILDAGVVIKERTELANEGIAILELLEKYNFNIDKYYETSNRDIQLKDFEIDELNEYIQKHKINPDTKIQKIIETLKTAYYSKRNSYKLSTTSKQKIKDLGALITPRKVEVIQKEKTRDKVLDMLTVLNNNGYKYNPEIDYENILLKDIELDNIDKIIEEHNWDAKYPIGAYINKLKNYYNENNLTKEYKDILKDLEMVKLTSNSIDHYIEIFEILKNEGINLNSIPYKTTTEEGKKRLSVLGDIKHQKIGDIIKKYNLDPATKIGAWRIIFKNLMSGGTNYKITKSQKDRMKKLGFDKTARENKTLEVLKIYNILHNEGVDLSKIRVGRWNGERRVFVLLDEIQDENIADIIKRNNLNPKWPIGAETINIRNLYKKGDKLVKEHISFLKDIGIIKDDLSKKEKEQKELLEEKEQARKLRNQAKDSLEKTEYKGKE